MGILLLIFQKEGIKLYIFGLIEIKTWKNLKYTESRKKRDEISFSMRQY